MNELAQKRADKVLQIVRQNPAGIFDHQITNHLNWEMSAVRAVCGILKKRGKLIIKEVEKDNKSQWFLLADDTTQEFSDNQDALKTVTERLGRAISDFLYVALRK